ncbi:hypothetical protein N431DRAFT_489220 [Stipitochalara longipes BDJ]|nr:hypothetical protein N431DRAFT_489220 [Stipitochalara longipes BDJ]
MEPSETRNVWKAQHMLCCLSYTFKDFSCFFEEKALGPMPNRRESIQHFARSFRNMSSLLLLASLKLKEAVLEFQPILGFWTSQEFLAPDDVDYLCQASLCDLFKMWKCIKPMFNTLQEDITFWSRDKTEVPLLKSPLDANYKTMAEVMSYAECLLYELLRKLKPLLGGYFETDLHILMKLGREIPAREKVKPQLNPAFYKNPKPLGTVLPFQSPYDIETVGNVMSQKQIKTWYPFRQLFYGAIETSRYFHTGTRNYMLPLLEDPQLCSHGLLPGLMRQMFSMSKASQLIKDEDIWIDKERTLKYKQFAEATTLRGVVSVSVAQKRIKKMVVSLHPTYMFLFRERGSSLILQQEIPRANILLVTHDSQLRQEVSVCWKSSSTEPSSIAYLKMIFDDATKAKVWASCLAPKDVPYEMIAKPTESEFSPQLLNLNGGSSRTMLVHPQVPPSKSSTGDKTMDQGLRLLSRIKNQNLDLLDYRIVYLSWGLEAVIIQDPHTETSCAAIDFVVDEVPSSLKAGTLSSGDAEKTSSDFSYYLSKKSHIGEYLEICGGIWHLLEEGSYKNCYIEVPTETGISPQIVPDHNFRGAVDKLILEFIPFYRKSHLDSFNQEAYRLHSMKLMVYSRESLDEMEGLVRESVLKTYQTIIK